MKGGMRLTALMNLPVIYILTHDSIVARTVRPISRWNSSLLYAAYPALRCSGLVTQKRLPQVGMRL